MNEIIEKTNDQPEFLKGCTICPDGLVEFVDRLIEESKKDPETKKLSQIKAIKLAAEKASAAVGVEGFFPWQSIRNKYRREKGIDDPAPRTKTSSNEDKSDDTKLNEDMPPEQASYAEVLTNNCNVVTKELTEFLPYIGDIKDEEQKAELGGALIALVTMSKRAIGTISPT